MQRGVQRDERVRGSFIGESCRPKVLSITSTRCHRSRVTTDSRRVVSTGRRPRVTPVSIPVLSICSSPLLSSMRRNGALSPLEQCAGLVAFMYIDSRAIDTFVFEIVRRLRLTSPPSAAAECEACNGAELLSIQIGTWSRFQRLRSVIYLV